MPAWPILAAQVRSAITIEVTQAEARRIAPLHSPPARRGKRAVPIGEGDNMVPVIGAAKHIGLAVAVEVCVPKVRGVAPRAAGAGRTGPPRRWNEVPVAAREGDDVLAVVRAAFQIQPAVAVI